MYNKYALIKSTRRPISADNATKDEEYICMSCDQLLILKKGETRVHHFAHYAECKKINSSFNESEDHLFGKYIIKYWFDNRFNISVTSGCFACSSNTTTVLNYNETCQIKLEYTYFIQDGSERRADVAIIENSEDTPKYVIEVFYKHQTQENTRDDPWFEVSATELLEKYGSCQGNNVNLTCMRQVQCTKCFNESFSNISPSKNIYFNQRGAGCGKTYESIQLLTSKQFSEKNIFIYLTKAHSAKTVIMYELQSQYDSGKLVGLEKIGDTQNNGKQIKMSFKSDRDIEVIIGTVDSFTYAICDKTKLVAGDDCDLFKNIVCAIKNNHIKVSQVNSIWYAGGNPIINTNCLIIIDEAQDLHSKYIEAFDKIITKTGIDVYVIGDKLQSLYGEDNIYTYIANGKFDNTIKHSSGVNKVMRFHNEGLKNFVNDIVPFTKYGLPQISDICTNCASHETMCPYDITVIPSCRKNMGDFEKYIFAEVKIRMDEQVLKYNYKPSDFMFIFAPIGADQAKRMEECLNKYWVDRFKDPKFRLPESETQDHYVQLHQSDQGRPIDLTQSEKKTRILSIYAAKGNGCKVVFVFGLSEYAFDLYNASVGDIKYESLLHVALTRQQKHIYIMLYEESVGDDIYKRFEKFGIKESTNVRYMIDKLSTWHQLSNLRSTALERKYDKIKPLITKYNINFSQYNPTSGQLIDQNHHIMRSSIAEFYFRIFFDWMEIYNDRTSCQIRAIFKSIAGKTPIIYGKSDHNKKLKAITERRNKNIKGSKLGEIKELPILAYDLDIKSKQYAAALDLKRIIENIQRKIKTHEGNFISDELKFNVLLCPLECIILNFIYEISQFGIKSKISTVEIYRILENYSECDGNKDYNCVCNRTSSKTLIHDYYSTLELIRTICMVYKEKVPPYKFNYYVNKNKKISNELVPKNVYITCDFQYIGISDEMIMPIFLYNQIDDLKRNRIVNDMLFSIYSLKKNKDHTERQITVCIISLSLSSPIFCQINLDESEINVMHSVITEIIKEKYKAFHLDVFKYCSTFEKTGSAALDEIVEALDKKDNIPKYITDRFKNMQGAIMESELGEDVYMKKNIRCEKTLISILDNALEKCMKNI